MQQSFSDYQPGGAGGAGVDTAPKVDAGYWELSKLKRAYTEYLRSKNDEIEEQKDARRYYHGAQWTDEQVKTLKKRKQPVVTFNRIGRKIDGVVGLVERLRQDPKAFPRTPKHEQGADLATAVLRYVLDREDWRAKSPEVARDAAVDGIGGLEIILTQGDNGDTEIGFDVVEPDGFFYDPRSYRLDFSDARFMGYGKWVDIDTAVEAFPDKEDELRGSVEKGTELTSNADREQKWFAADGQVQRIRLVDCWYKHKGKWCWTIFTGSTVIDQGESYLVDEKGESQCKYVMFSGNVDHDGDRYGFIRNMRSAQDEINHRKSKGLHELNSKRLILTQHAVQDIETARREWARPDGVVILNPGGEAKSEDKTADLGGQLKFLEDAKAEIENFGPNPALIGQGIENKSGRAIALLQQAGIAELGPYILAYKGWKIRVYRALWNAVQRHWSAERWIRVTDDENVAQFVQINGIGLDPMTGQPVLVNAIGSLDVDIIVDEGPDQINMQADAFEALTQILPNVAPMLTPPEAQVILKALFELAPLAGTVKKQVKDGFEQANAAAQQPNPIKQAADQLQLADADAKVKETQSKTVKNLADAHQKVAQTFMPVAPAMPGDMPPPMAAPPGAGMAMMPQGPF